MAPVPLLTANGRCGFDEETLATTRGKRQDAPIPDLPALVPERGGRRPFQKSFEPNLDILEQIKCVGTASCSRPADTGIS
jgi:hypothetical protein